MVSVSVFCPLVVAGWLADWLFDDMPVALSIPQAHESPTSLAQHDAAVVNGGKAWWWRFVSAAAARAAAAG